MSVRNRHHRAQDVVVTAISAATMISSPNQMEVWEHGSCQAVTGTWERAWATWQALNS